jgi:hypothetical protein
MEIQESIRQAAIPSAGFAVSKGDIFVSSWGYEQTNVDFYRVVEPAAYGKFAKLQKIAKKMVDSSGYSSMAGKCVADLDSPGGEIFSKKVLGQKYGAPSFKFSSYSYASKWDGREKYVSWYA